MFPDLVDGPEMACDWYFKEKEYSALYLNF
jgi:hypothetical protein